MGTRRDQKGVLHSDNAGHSIMGMRSKNYVDSLKPRCQLTVNIEAIVAGKYDKIYTSCINLFDAFTNFFLANTEGPLWYQVSGTFSLVMNP